MNKIYISLLGMALSVLLVSCSNEPKPMSTTTTESDDHDDHDDHGHEDVLTLTKQQVEAVGLKYGGFRKIRMSDFVQASGTMGLPPNAYSSVSAKVEGFIKNSKKYVEGSYVKKGAEIASIENPILFEKQQSWLEIDAELTYLQQELDRQRTLFNQNAGVEKNVQKLESEVAIKRAQKLGVENYLEYVGISKDQIRNGNFYKRIAITAPISGFITSIEMHNGMFIKPEQQLLEIVSEDHIHLEMDIFEADIAKISKDQRISYSIPALGSDIYEGHVHEIGREFDSENKTVRVHGHLVGKKPKFIKDLFISAKIWLNESLVFALPEGALILESGSSFIFVGKPDPNADILEFQKIEVVPGASDNGNVAVKLLAAMPDGFEVVTEGAYFVFAKSKEGEKVHEH